jgi:hypothetical protein
MDTTLIVVVIVGLLNLIAFYGIKDWNAIAVFLLVATVTFFFTQNPVYMLVTAMVATSLYRASKTLEGFEKSEIKEGVKEPVPKVPVPMDNVKRAAKYEPEKLFDSSLEEQFGNLQKNNESLLNNIKALAPLMKQSGELFKAMPPELLTRALKNFGKGLKKKDDE